MDRNALDGLIAFRLIGDCLSYGDAARELGISVPALSRIIRNLERRLGVELFHRTWGARVALSEAGDQFLRQVRPGLDQVLAAMRKASAQVSKDQTRFR